MQHLFESTQSTILINYLTRSYLDSFRDDLSVLLNCKQQNNYYVSAKQNDRKMAYKDSETNRQKVPRHGWSSLCMLNVMDLRNPLKWFYISLGGWRKESERETFLAMKTFWKNFEIYKNINLSPRFLAQLMCCSSHQILEQKRHK
jgi:hypothetical protein